MHEVWVVLGCRKTLQGIALLWTLLQSGHELLGGNPLAKRVIICCPTSLVSNWDSECGKWLKVSLSTPVCRLCLGFVWHEGPLNSVGHDDGSQGALLKGLYEVQGRVRTLPLSESSREDVISSIADFMRPNTMYQVDLERQKLK